MEIINVSGYQLEKSVPTSPEDAFVRSEVTYNKNSQEKSFSILYLAYFESYLMEFSPFDQDPVMTVGEVTYNFKDVAALAALLKHPEFENSKKLYFHDLEDFKKLFEELDWEKLKQVLIKFTNETSNPSNV